MAHTAFELEWLHQPGAGGRVMPIKAIVKLSVMCLLLNFNL